MGSDGLTVSPRETQLTAAVDDTQMTRHQGSTVQGLETRPRGVNTHAHGFRFCPDCRENEEEG